MDGRSFDTLARGIGVARTRRDALKGIAAGLFGLGAARGASAQVTGELARCGQKCRNSAQCNAGLRCASGRCARIPDSRDSCRRNTDCKLDYEVCQSQRCVNDVVCNNNNNRCDRDGDCPGSQVCRGGRCESGCRTSNDCRSDETCRNGRCEKNSNDCRRDSDCRNDEVCNSGRCVVRGRTCDRDRDCPSGEKCVNKRCERAGNECKDNGDCRSDQKCRRNRCVARK